MLLGIIGAMEEEINEIKNIMEIDEELVVVDTLFYRGKIEDVDVCVCQSGIGKVNAAMTTTLLHEKYQPDYIINIGTAGGLDSLTEKVGDVVISNKTAHHDFYVGFGRDHGEVPGLPVYFESDSMLIEKVENAFHKISDVNTHLGLVVSGDQFVNKNELISVIKGNFPNVKAVEMEGAAIAQVCYKYKTPFIIVRGLSDIASVESDVDFYTYLTTASKNSAKMLKELIVNLK